MGTREGVGDGGLHSVRSDGPDELRYNSRDGARDGGWYGALAGNPLSRKAAQQRAWAAMPAPPAVRAILAAWAEPGDGAPLLPRERDPAALLACYRDIVAARAPGRLALALLQENARLNADFGLWSELRREARVVLQWLAISPVQPGPPCTFPDSATVA